MPRLTDELAEAIRRLAPQNDAQKHLQAKAEAQLASLADVRWLIFEQTQNPLPPVFLIVLGFWLIQLFIGLGLIAPRNSTSVIAMLTCALSMSAAVFLVLEMNHPFDGSSRSRARRWRQRWRLSASRFPE